MTRGLPESRIRPPSAAGGLDLTYWHSCSEHDTEEEVSLMIGGLVTGLAPDTVVELGAYHGQTSQAICYALAAARHGYLWSLELDPACCEIASRRVPVAWGSVLQVDARTWIPPAPVDCLYIDHGDPATRFEVLDHYLPHLSPRAVVVWHDTGPQFELRSQLLMHWVMELEWQIVLLPTSRGVGLMHRPSSDYTAVEPPSLIV